MSDGTSGRTPSGQAPPNANGATTRNGRADDSTQPRTRAGEPGEAEVTRPQPAVRPANPSYNPPQRANPAQRAANPGQRPIGSANGSGQRPVPTSNGQQGRTAAPANASQTRPASSSNGQTDRAQTSNGTRSASPQRAQPLGATAQNPAPTDTAKVPIWDTHPAPELKPSFLERLGSSLGFRKGDDKDDAGAKPEARPVRAAPTATPPPTAAEGAAAVTAFSPAPARPQDPAPVINPGNQPVGRRAATPAVPASVPTTESAAPQGLTTGAPMPPRVAPGAPVTQTVAPGQVDDLAERGPITQPLPVVPGPAPALKTPAQAETLAAGRANVGFARRTRKARLRLSRLDPWSVMKTSFLFSIAAGIMLVVAVYAIWTVLNTSGLFDSVNEIVKSVVSTPGDTTPFRIQEYVNTQKVMGVAALVACVDVLLVTALATLGSFLYNLAATMLGGLEVTLAED